MIDIAFILLSLAVLLAAIALLQPLAQRLAMPFSVLLAGVGVGLGLLIVAPVGLPEAGPIADLLEGLRSFEIGSEAILYVFLPILLFEAGITINVPRMLDDVAPILLLAIVAVLVCTFVVGLALWGVSDTPLIVTLLLGAIIATTDPVAVLGIFRDIGAPRRLSILVEGESLFNDAAAIVLSSILLALLTTGQEATFLDGSAQFLWSFIGGGLAGYLAALLLSLLLTPLRNLPLAETALTFALPYIVFVAAEHYLHVSGVVAVIVAALVIGANGRVRVSPDTWESLHAVWRQVGFFASSLVFVFASMLVPRLLTEVSWTDAMLLAVVVAAAMAARAIVMFGLMPILSRTGLAERISTDYKLVLVWGGLRGAVTLALALSVTENVMVSPEVKHFIGVLATGYVLSTLLVNAPTLRLLMRLLKMDELTPLDRSLRNRTIELALTSVGEKLEETAEIHHIPREASRDIVAQYREQPESPAGTTGFEVPLTPDEQTGLGLITLANREEELYLRHFADETIARATVVGLLAKVGRARDAVKTNGLTGYFEACSGGLDFDIRFRAANLLHRLFRVEGPLAGQIANRFEALTLTRIVIEELKQFSAAKLVPLLGNAITGRLKQVLAERLDNCVKAIEALQLQYPDYARMLQQRFLRQVALRLEEAEYRNLLEEQVISPELFSDLVRSIRMRWEEVSARPRLDLGLQTVDLVRRLPMFQSLDGQRIGQVATLLRPRLAYPGERLITAGERGDFMCFISSGAVEVRRDGYSIRLGRGDFFGELALLGNRWRTADVYAIGYCQLLTLTRPDFFQFLRANPDLRAHIREVAEARLAPIRAAAAPAGE